MAAFVPDLTTGLARGNIRMPQIVAIRVKDAEGNDDAIAVVLSQDAVCLSPNGEPWSAVSLNPQVARCLAQNLLVLAREIEEQGQSAEPTYRSLTEINSILVLHDCSEQSNRAFNFSMDLASRSKACIHLVGVYGVRQDTCEPSPIADDCIWQRDWLKRLVAMYSLQAEQGGIELRTTLIAAADQQELSEVFDGGRFDLVVLPRRFSDDGTADSSFRLFRQSLVAGNSNIFFCS